MKYRPPDTEALTAILDTCKDPARTDFAHGWVGIEPTFQTRKSVRKWQKMAAKPGGEDAYFCDSYMLKQERRVAKAIRKTYRAHCAQRQPHCLFADVEIKQDHDKWGTRRQKLCFHWDKDSAEPLMAGFSLDPETFEYGIKPVPVAWFYDERFVAFLEQILWQVPQSLGLSCAMAHGGGEFHLSVKSYMTGSLLADDIAYRLDHPELCSWTMCYPQCDSRSFRATRARKAAFEQMLRLYWSGHFHPAALGGLTPENAFLDRGFGPALQLPRKRLVDPRKGPLGSAQEIFQTNFAFGRALRWRAQDIHPGYWQSAHPDEDGYRPDQVMRYSEGNLNRLEIAGELHVKSNEVLDPTRVPELGAALDLSMLATEASFENRAQMSRTSARDFVEAMLLDIHHAQYLQAHPHVKLRGSLAQDALLSEATDTLRRHGGGKLLSRLHREARASNLDISNGRIKSDWIEPETLFWAAWSVLPRGKKLDIACEAISGFLERVEQASTMDKRERLSDPMEWHRHRIHPLLWSVLEVAGSKTPKSLRKEYDAWQSGKVRYLARRPIWSQDPKNIPPWETYGA